MSEEMNDFESPGESSGNDGGSKNKLYIGIGIGCVVLLLFACCIIFAVVIFVDPFDLNLLSRFRSGGNTTAQVMPADTEVFIGLDLLALASEDFISFVDVFASELSEADANSYDDFMSNMDSELFDTTGFNFSDDVLPWLGQFGGFGMTNIRFDQFGEVDDFDFVLAMEATDTGAADAFFEKFEANYTQQTDIAFIDREYEGVTIRMADTTDEFDEIAHVRIGRIVLLAQKVGALEDAIDAEKGDSLADNAGFKDLAAELDAGSFMNFYMDNTFIEELLRGIDADGLDISNLPTSAWTQVMFSALVTEEGLQIDYVYTVDEEALTDLQKQISDAAGQESKMPELLPESTLLYFTSQRLDLSWQLIKTQLDQMSSGDFDESLDLMQDEFGINVDADLFPYLDGEWAMLMLGSDEGMIAQEDIPVGLAMLMETSNPDALHTTVTTFNASLADLGFFDIENASVAGSDIFSAGSFGENIAVYGVVDNYMTIATSASMLEEVFESETPLSQSPLYQRVSAVFPDNMNIVGFVDMHETLNAIVEGMSDFEREQFAEEAAPFLQPIRAFGAAVSGTEGGMARASLILIVDR